MFSSPQRTTIVLEHASATIDFDGEEYDDGKAWSVVAYLITDSGERMRTTLYRCQTRDEACGALKKIWSDLSKRSPCTASAA